MATIYYVQDGSSGDAGWAASEVEVARMRAALVDACGPEYADCPVEEHDVSTLSDAIIDRLALRAPDLDVRAIATAEQARRAGEA